MIAGATRYLPVAPFEMPNFADLARVMVGTARDTPRQRTQSVVRADASGGGLWTPAGVDAPLKEAA